MGKAKHIAFIMYQICLFRFGSLLISLTHTPRACEDTENRPINQMFAWESNRLFVAEECLFYTVFLLLPPEGT